MALLIIGGVLIGMATVFDTVFRLRMTRLGHRTAFLLGGALNYAEYHRVRVKEGWPAWPVYLMWALYICGIGLLIAGFFVYFGTQPQRSS